jgi:hypothetical protein
MTAAATVAKFPVDLLNFAGDFHTQVLVRQGLRAKIY